MAEGRRWGTIGGHVVLDLVDTVSWRLTADRVIDYLPAPDDLIEWAADRGLIGEQARAALRADAQAHSRQAQAVLRRVVELRGAVTRMLDEQLLSLIHI